VSEVAVRRDTNGKWLPGTSGNPQGGRRDPELALVRSLAREKTETAIATLEEIALDRSAQAMARVRAAEVLLSRGWGQPSPEVDLDVVERLADGPVVFRFRMSEEEPFELDASGVDEAEWTDAGDATPSAA